MSKKIYFSPSDQTRNAYAVGDTTEAIQCRKIAEAAVKAAAYNGFQAKTNVTAGGDAGMEIRVEESNAFGADLHIPIHTNAHNSEVKGTRIFVYSTDGEGYKAAKAIMEALAPITPGTSDSITVKHFYEVHAADAPTVYLEVAFHDNPVEAQWIIDHTEDIAEAIVKGCCNYYGMTYRRYHGNASAAEQGGTADDGIYNTVEEVPEYGKATVQKLIDKGVLAGKKSGLALTEDMVRLMVYNDRAGLYD